MRIRRPAARGTSAQHRRSAAAPGRHAPVIHRRAEPVRHAPTAHRDPAVRGALRVHVRVRLVRQGLASRSSRLLPGRVASAARYSHGAVHRGRPPQPGRRAVYPSVQRGMTWSELAGSRRARRPRRCRPRHARVDLRDRRRLVDLHPTPLRRLRIPAANAAGCIRALAARTCPPIAPASFMRDRSSRRGQELGDVLAVPPRGAPTRPSRIRASCAEVVATDSRRP